jgi:colanic acid biosynthesis protein WcaH
LKSKGWIKEPQYSEIKKIMPLPCVDLLIKYQNKILLLKRNNPPLKNQWFTPGSRVLMGENLKDAVNRTLREETGLTATNIEQKGAMVQKFDELQSVTIFYRVDVSGDNVILNEDHSDYKWIDKDTHEIHPYISEMLRKAKIS